MRRSIPILTAAALLAWAGAASALTVPFTEDFGSDVAGWEDNINESLTHVGSGGPDGGSYASGSFDFTGFESPFPDANAGPIVFRAHDEDAASGGAFIGNWNTGGVTQIRAFVRHDAPTAITWNLRIATSNNFPGAVFEPSDTTVASNQWTELVFEIDPTSSACTAEGFQGFTCEDALSSVGHLQLGTDAPQQLIDDEVAVTFDVDQVSIVPEPGTASLALAGLAGLGALGRGRAARRR